MNISKLNKSIKELFDNANGAIESFVVYNKSDGLVITGESIDYEKSAIYHSICLTTRNTSRNFKFSKGVQGYSILLKNKKMIYSSILSKDFLFTVILDLNQIQLGYFKGILLKKFLEENQDK